MDSNYTVVGINGFRRANLTRDQAIQVAARMQRQMRNAGWAGKMRVYYRDGSELHWEPEEEDLDADF